MTQTLAVASVPLPPLAFELSPLRFGTLVVLRLALSPIDLPPSLSLACLRSLSSPCSELLGFMFSSTLVFALLDFDIRSARALFFLNSRRGKEEGEIGERDETKSSTNNAVSKLRRPEQRRADRRR